MKDENRIFLVDDDALFLKSLETAFLAHGDFHIQTFATGEKCIAALVQKPDLVILDYHLDGIDPTAIDGMQTLDRIKSLCPDIPVVMLSSQDRIDVAINCMHHQALDYVVKSETAFIRLQGIIANIFHFKKMKQELSWYMERM
jgi:two-component system, OmpR family, response regulator